ncbi:YveK family protein [Paenibacillus sp. 1P07SE]|uniref:YveK family protein n=1 Tax=Paenibacillus sp. 1P07SE TaxID=3132209 RepID=UPI0039A537B6
MELQGYLRVLKQRWWIAAVLAVMSCTAVFVYSNYYVQPVYQASTDLIVNKPADTAATTGQPQVDQNSINTNLMLINTYKQIIKSPAVLRQVLETNPGLGLTTQELNEKVTIDSVRDTQMMTISVQDSSYEQAAAIVTAVSNGFRERVSTVMNLDNVSVLNAADPADNPAPINTNHNVLYLFALMVSVMVGLGLIFLLDYLDDTVKSEHQIEQVLGLTLLTKVPKIRSKDMARQASMKVKQPEQAAVLRSNNSRV